MTSLFRGWWGLPVWPVYLGAGGASLYDQYIYLGAGGASLARKCTVWPVYLVVGGLPDAKGLASL